MVKKTKEQILVSILLIVCLFTLGVIFLTIYRANLIVKNANTYYSNEFSEQNQMRETSNM